MMWTKVPAGDINAATQRFWVGVGDQADEVARTMNGNSHLVARVCTFAKNNGDQSLDRELEDWAKLYRDGFGLEVDPKQIAIPPYQYGFSRLVVVGKGITCNRAYDVCAEQFECPRWKGDLDTSFATQNDREPINHYAIWVRNRTRADHELRGLSANRLKSRNIVGITLLERLLLGLKYYVETGIHLDQNEHRDTSETICSGSRGSTGGVARVRWLWDDSSALSIDGSCADDCYDGSCGREVIA